MERGKYIEQTKKMIAKIETGLTNYEGISTKDFHKVEELLTHEQKRDVLYDIKASLETNLASAELEEKWKWLDE